MIRSTPLRHYTPSALLFSFAAILLLMTTSLTAAPSIKADGFGSLLILENGRLKPLDTYARSYLLRISGRQSYKGMCAATWLAHLVFDPLEAAEDKIFLVNNPEIADAIGITPQKRRRYSFNELKTGYDALANAARAAAQKEPRVRSPFENEVCRVFEAFREYMQISSVFMYMMPSSEFTVEDSAARSYLNLGHDTHQFSYFDIVSRVSLISNAIKTIQQKSSEQWTVSDMTMISLTQTLRSWEESREDQPFHICPVKTDGKEEWLCPWILTLNTGTAAPHQPFLLHLTTMRKAFLDNNEAEFKAALKGFTELVRSEGVDLSGASTELLYNSINSFSKAKIAYGIAAILALLLLTAAPNKFTSTGSVILLITGMAFHTYGIVARILIMHRPPLATVYETFIFVAWSCVVLGLVLELLQKKSLGLLIASVCGFFFLHIAGRYNTGVDTMGMVAAVLNSNFWLTTHIMSISLGYAGCCCAGIVGHVYLIKSLFLRIPREKLVSTYESMYGILAFVLVFTVIGTMLGGMWADQSWGRFWGWDPKENGALLIILWCAAVFHARSAAIIKERGFAVGAILSFVLVMFAWIGVNLLGIGMHSYGFTSSGVSILYSFMIFETVFLITSTVVFFLESETGNRSGQGT